MPEPAGGAETKFRGLQSSDFQGTKLPNGFQQKERSRKRQLLIFDLESFPQGLA